MTIKQLNELVMLKRALEASEQVSRNRAAEEFEAAKKRNNDWFAAQESAAEKRYENAVAQMNMEHNAAVAKMHREHEEAVKQMNYEFENEWGRMNDLFGAIRKFHSL